VWQIDCENYRTAGGPFQIKDVSTEEHQMFIKLFCERYGYAAKMAGTTAEFSKAESPANKDSQPGDRRRLNQIETPLAFL
jgi:hypothetical protein